MPVINNTLCEGMYRNAGYIEHIPHIFICAGYRKGGYDSCEGRHFLLNYRPQGFSRLTTDGPYGFRINYAIHTRTCMFKV